MENMTFELDGKKIQIFPGTIGSPEIYLNSYMDNGEKIYRLLRELQCPEHSLIVVSGLNWNDDMTPWYCPPLFASDTACGGKADEYLVWMKEKLFPEAECRLEGKGAYAAITGYSLAGLFAVYSLYHTDIFDRAASMSGSLWYPDFLPYLESRKLCRKPSCLYFSLGDREKNTRIKLLRAVQDNTQAIAEKFKNEGIETVFEMNPGNHYKNSEQRTARGIQWILLHENRAEAEQ
jgi:predicted alpha/beta superfamily hydrolase